MNAFERRETFSEVIRAFRVDIVIVKIDLDFFNLSAVSHVFTNCTCAEAADHVATELHFDFLDVLAHEAHEIELVEVWNGECGGHVEM